MAAVHVLIAGAGIGGLAAALRLARQGLRVSLFETAPALEEIGAGLQLSPNATAILARLGALERLRGASLAPTAVRVRRARDGATLALMPLDQPHRRWGAPYLLAHRADLQGALLDAASAEPAITLHLGVTVESFASGRESVIATVRRHGPGAEERFEAAGDCLIAADGSRSRLRGEMLGAAAAGLSLSRRTAWRALVPAERAPAQTLVSETTLWLGPQAHLVHYPLRGGSVVNIVAIVEEEGVADIGPFWSNDADPAGLLRRFSGWDRDALALLQAAEGWRKWRLHDRDPLPRWSAGRVALLGDAAHPMLPFLAQGAAQAIEDADALGAAMAAGGDIAAALLSYGRSRLARASRVQARSRAQERIYHLAGPAAALRDLALRALGGDLMLRRYDWLYRVSGADTPVRICEID